MTRFDVDNVPGNCPSLLTLLVPNRKCYSALSANIRKIVTA